MTTSEIKATPFVFPHETLIPISGKPDHNTVTMLIRQLYANAYDNECTLGGGIYGYMGLIMPAEDYIEFPYAIAWTLPPKPAGAASDDDRKMHQQLLLDIRTMDACLKKQLLAAVEHVYLLSIDFATCTTADILAYITIQYDIIDYDDLQANRKKLDEPWDSSEPIELLWNRIDTCQRFAKAGGSEISDITAISATYDVLIKTGVFTDYARIWKYYYPAECTMTAFRKFFHGAERELKKVSSVNVLSDVPTNATSTSPGTCKDDTKKNIPYLLYGDMKIWYCWSHGGCTSEKHTSNTCTRAKPGHVRYATWDNMCGGNGAMNWAPKNRNFKLKTT